ncbi:MAG: hypothetical protein WCT25_01475 [Candidatus Paceibacterota bacterium]
MIQVLVQQAFPGRQVQKGSRIGTVFKILPATQQIIVELPIPPGSESRKTPKLETWNASDCTSLARSEVTETSQE